MSDTAFSLTEVTKTFRLGVWKKKTAVENISFSVNRGEIVGLLGPNGSGKSTTLKMIMGFLRATSGEILVGGKNAQEDDARTELGYLPENPRFPKFLTGRELMRFYGHLLALRGKALDQKVDELLTLVKLATVADERIQGYSKGMTQRLAVAQSLLGNPSVLIFDEPMSGLDPLGRMEMRRLISQIQSERPHSTILFSTHILNDVESLCSSVLLIRNGKLIKQCVIGDLLESDQQRFELNLAEVPQPLRRSLSEKGGRVTPGGLTIWLEGTTDTLIDQLVSLKAAGVKVVSVASQRKTLEEALFGNEVPRATSAQERTGT